MPSSKLLSFIVKRESAVAKPPLSADTIDAVLDGGFAEATREARETALASGVAVAVVVDGRVCWLHPDGQVYPSATPVHDGPATQRST